MKTTEQELAAEYQEKLAKLRQKNKLRAELPEQFQADAIISIPGSRYASVKMWNDFRTTKTLADALEIVRLYSDKIVTAEHWRAGCVSTWPAEINSCIKNESAVMDGSHEIEISVGGGKRWGPTVEVSMWVRLADILVEINLPVCDARKLVPHVHATYNNHGELAKCDIFWPSERAVFDSFRSFWSEKPAFKGSYYCAEWRSFENWALAQAKKAQAAA